MNRLLLIKRLREAEESGDRPVPMTLAEIRDALDRIPANELSFVAQGHVPISVIDRHLDPSEEGAAEPAASGPPSDDWEAEFKPPPGLVPSASRMDLMLDETDEPDLFIPRMKRISEPMKSQTQVAEDSSIDADDEPEVHACMAPPPPYGERHADPDTSEDDLETLLTRLCRRTAHRPAKRSAAESWTKVAITPGLELAARDSDHSTRSLLDRIAELLRRQLAESLNRR